MSDVKRYTLWWESESGAELDPYQETDADGKWVLASDYDALLAGRDALQAARYAYASEFAPGVTGDPDVGSVHASIRALKAERDRLKARNEWLEQLAVENAETEQFLRQKIAALAAKEA